jgi:ACR3 family arsenite efflux pump ArsB
MRLSETLQPLVILLAVLLGLVLGQVPMVAERAAAFVLPLLMLMLVSVFLYVPLQAFGAALRHPKFTGLSLGINFLWTPVFAWGLGAVFLRQQPDLWVGLIMLLVTPCTDWYLVFTQLARGDVRLATALLPWKLVLQLALLPGYLLVFAGALVPLEPAVLLESVVLVLVIPLITAQLLRLWLKRNKWVTASALTAKLQLIFLSGAITAMFASQGGAILAQPEVTLQLLAPLLVFFSTNLLLGIGMSRWMSFDDATCVSLCFATLSRNSPLSLAIAVAAFPERPLIALVLVIGPLIELPLMALIAQGLRRYLRRS